MKIPSPEKIITVDYYKKVLIEKYPALEEDIEETDSELRELMEEDYEPLDLYCKLDENISTQKFIEPDEALSNSDYEQSLREKHPELEPWIEEARITLYSPGYKNSALDLFYALKDVVPESGFIVEAAYLKKRVTSEIIKYLKNNKIRFSSLNFYFSPISDFLFEGKWVPGAKTLIYSPHHFNGTKISCKRYSLEIGLFNRTLLIPEKDYYDIDLDFIPLEYLLFLHNLIKKEEKKK